MSRLWTRMHEHGTTHSPRPFLVVGAVALATLGAGVTMFAAADDGDVASSPATSVSPSTAAPADIPAEVAPPAPTTPVPSAEVAAAPTPQPAPEPVTEPVPEPDPDVEPDVDPDPEPGAVPEGLVPLDLTDPDVPPPFGGIVEAFTRVELPQPTPTPLPLPTFEPFALTDGGGSGNGLTPGGLSFTAATGCADHCIDDATISTAGGSSSRYDLRVDLENAATVEAYLSMAPIQRNADGRHIPPSSVPTASGAAGFFWTTSFDLEPSTEYHLLVLAIDEQGTSSVAGSFTTAEAMGPDALATPSACDDGCLEFVSTEFADDGTELAVAVRVTVDATVEFAWSTDQFVQGDDGPTLDGPSTQTIDAVAGSISTLRLGGLTPNTAYSVMATATDDLGGTDRFVGRIATPSPTIYAGIARVHVSGDGDDGRLNRGEISFLFGTVGDGYDLWGHRGEAKISSNTTIQMDGQASGFLYADGSGHYPSIQLFAGERDGNSVRDCFSEADPDGDWRPDDVVSWCNNERWTYSQTAVPSLTLAEIEQLPSCDTFGVDRPGADRCAWVQTNPNSSDQVSFDMVVWFDLD